jgi:hypothetical protein
MASSKIGAELEFLVCEMRDSRSLDMYEYTGKGKGYLFTVKAYVHPTLTPEGSHPVSILTLTLLTWTIW